VTSGVFTAISVAIGFALEKYKVDGLLAPLIPAQIGSDPNVLLAILVTA
jgi:hypothetical protein